MLSENRRHQPRCVAIWRRFLHPRPQFIWKTLWAAKSDIMKEFLWRLTHQVLPTKDYLRKWVKSVDPLCPFCHYPEDIHHAIIVCQRAQTMWANLQRLLTAIVGQHVPITLETLVFRHNLPQDAQAEEICHYIATTAAQTLLSTRNRKTYNNTYQPGDGKQHVTSVIKKRIQADYPTNPRVEQFWSYKQVLVQKTDGKLMFNI